MATALTGIIVAIYWAKVGLSVFQIGILTTVGLGGGTLATLGVSLLGDHWGRKRILLLISFLSIGGGIALAFISSFYLLCGVTFLGMVNGMGRDRMAAFSLEQSILSSVSTVKERTWSFATYTLIVDIGHALGGLAAGIPFLLRSYVQVSDVISYQWSFLVYSFFLLVSVFCYFGLSRSVELDPNQPKNISHASLERVRKFSSISFFDALGGGFLTSSLVAYWFFKTYGVTEEVIGILFFASRIANAFSLVAATKLSEKIGLINTMVFTHIPASVLLIVIAFAPPFWMTCLLFLFRECLVEMDVPTRQSYLASIVSPHERTFALGMVGSVRNLGWTISPSIAGFFMKGLSLSAPFFVGSSIKIFYDLWMYKVFRKIHPE